MPKRTMGNCLDVNHAWPQSAVLRAKERTPSKPVVLRMRQQQNQGQRSQVRTREQTAQNSPKSLQAVNTAQKAEFDALVLRAQKGDKAAFGVIVLELQEPLYRTVFRLVRHSQDARDIAQRALLRGWTRLPELQATGAFRSWLFSIGLNLARNHLRNRGNKRFEAIQDTTVAVQPTAYSALNAHEQRLKLRSALEQLPEKQREVVTLRIDAEMSFKEISDAVGCSEGSARVNFHHGMKRLREIVTRTEG